MPAPLLAAVAVGGAIIQGIGSLKAGKARAEAAKRQARLNRLQAIETLNRDRTNRFLFTQKGEQTKAQQIAAFTKSGVDISSNSVLETLESTESQVLRQNLLSQREAQFSANQIRQGARATEQAGAAAQRAGVFQAVGGLFRSVSDFAEDSTPAGGGAK